MIRTSLRRVALLLSLIALGGCIDRGSGVTQPGTTGSLQITVSGLPNGAAPSITVSGPSGFSTSLNGSKTLSDLTPGTYTITAAQVVSGTATYAPVPTQTTVSVIASTTPATAGIAYQLASGSLTVSIGGLPTGVAGSVLVSGPSGFTQTLGSTQTLANLKPGSYTVTPNSIVSGGTRYSAGAIQTVTVNATIAATIATVTYVVSSGSLSITVSGLPNGANASVSITGPGSFSQTITASQTLQLLTPGTYTIAANPVSVSSQLWSGTPASQSVSVIASTTAATASVTYSQTTAQLTVTISGLPGGTNADVTVTGPGAFSQHLTASAVLNNLALGTYTISAANVSTATALYGPSAASQTVTFSTSLTSATKTVTYSQISGALTVTVSGLPNGVNAAVTVTGPGSFSQSVTATTTITKLTTGTYTIAAANVTSGSTTYAPAPSSQTATVNAGATASATVTYSAVSPGGVNLTIDGLYITQSTQNYAGSIPLIKDRNGFLRVFVKADQANSVQPQVRVRIYNGASLVQTYTINAPGASVPTAINEGALASSWNVAVPGSLIQPGYKILADVDPTNSITESNEADNCFPVSCSAQSMSVQTATTFNITLVPVKQSVNNLTGNATSANKDQILSMTMGIHPLPGYNAVVRSVYTTNAPALASDGTNWITVLNEIQALRVADSTASPYHGTYYGVVAVSYGSGVAGLGYIGYPAAIGWDYASSAPRIAAHELGHTFGRLHAPCGNPAGPDPNWPTDPGHTNAHLGTYGYDVANNVLYAPSTNYDVMSYCTPQWISDYT